LQHTVINLCPLIGNQRVESEGQIHHGEKVQELIHLIKCNVCNNVYPKTRLKINAKMRLDVPIYTN